MKIGKYNGLCNVCGVKIKEERKRQKLSQEQLAAKLQLLGLDISQRAVSRVESGLRIVPDYEIEFFAKVLKVQINWLLERN